MCVCVYIHVYIHVYLRERCLVPASWVLRLLSIPCLQLQEGFWQQDSVEQGLGIIVGQK